MNRIYQFDIISQKAGFINKRACHLLSSAFANMLYYHVGNEEAIDQISRNDLSNINKVVDEIKKYYTKYFYCTDVTKVMGSSLSLWRVPFKDGDHFKVTPAALIRMTSSNTGATHFMALSYVAWANFPFTVYDPWTGTIIISENLDEKMIKSLALRGYMIDRVDYFMPRL